MNTLLQFIPAVFILLIIPGPDMLYCVVSGVSHGRSGALLAAAGIGFGGLLLTAVAAFIIFVFARIDPKIFNALQILGSGYLLYLGLRILIAKPKSATNSPQQNTPRHIFWRGVLTNLSNPKALVFFLSFIPQFIPPAAAAPHLHYLLLGAVLCVIGTTFNFVCGLTGLSLQGLSAKTIRGRAIADYITALLFISIAVIFLLAQSTR